MSDLIPDNSSASNLFARVKDILLKPADTWNVIDSEEDSIGSLFSRYVIPLAAIGPVASIIGQTVFGIPIPFLGTFKLGIGTAIAVGVTSFIGALVGVYILSLVIDMLAPSFGGTKNPIQAFKASAYAMTAAWVGGIFGIFPAIAMLGLLASFYSLYLLYLGEPKLMKAPADKAVGYVVVTILVAIVVMFVVNLITDMITGPMIAASMGAAAMMPHLN